MKTAIVKMMMMRIMKMAIVKNDDENDEDGDGGNLLDQALISPIWPLVEAKHYRKTLKCQTLLEDLKKPFIFK